MRFRMGILLIFGLMCSRWVEIGTTRAARCFARNSVRGLWVVRRCDASGGD